MRTPLIMLGAGGHAKVLIDTLRYHNEVELIGILDRDSMRLGHDVSGVKILGDESQIEHYSPDQIQLINGLGSTELPLARMNVFKRFKSKGYRFFSVRHENSYVAHDVRLGEGVQIMAGSILQAGSVIGDNVIINTRACVEHDCRIDDHVHLAPGTVLSGGVWIGKSSHIGTGAVIVQGITLGEGCLVGAGAVVICDVKASSRVIGVPAKKML